MIRCFPVPPPKKVTKNMIKKTIQRAKNICLKKDMYECTAAWELVDELEKGLEKHEETMMSGLPFRDVYGREYTLFHTTEDDHRQS